MKAIIVKSSDLGDCWDMVRFVGGECRMLDRCKHKCKATCNAYRDVRVYSIKRITAKG